MLSPECSVDCSVVVSIVFFQAEDGIRDLVRSRGLGDVYKRQPDDRAPIPIPGSGRRRRSSVSFGRSAATCTGAQAVSYTHLTLPTSDLV